jgi:flavin-dependent dehydrogenase
MSSQDNYDVIIVGARAAGAATAMLLARAGVRVLVVDRSQYGADTVSTHALMRAGVLQLHRWGLIDELIAAGTPPIRRTTFHTAGEPIVVDLKPAVGVDALYAPRRTVLDPILIDAAVAAGADVRFGVNVMCLLRDDDGRVSGIVGRGDHRRRITARGRITVGADGMGSSVARWVSAPMERLSRASAGFAYGYWSGIDLDGYQWFFRPGGAAGAIPTNGGQTCVFVGTPSARFRRELVPDVTKGFPALLDEIAPELAAPMAEAQLMGRLRRFAGRPGQVRRAWGPGWALVGDAGYFKDPISAHGLTDALRDAELLAHAIVDGFDRSGDEAVHLAAYQATRDRLSEELFTVTETISSFGWNATEVDALLLQLSAAMVDEVEMLAALDQAAA